MWLELESGSVGELSLVDRQSIWPSPDGTDAELIVNTEARLRQEVVLTTARVARLLYTIESAAATMVLGNAPPAPWPDTATLTGKSFELMLTDRGAMLVPSQGPKLANRLRSWLEAIAEAIRSSWAIPPDEAREGLEWQLLPAVPGGLPPGATSAQVKVRYRLEHLTDQLAEVSMRYGVRLTFAGLQKIRRGEGRGDARVQLDRRRGVESAARSGHLELIRPELRSQMIRSAMKLQRLA